MITGRRRRSGRLRGSARPRRRRSSRTRKYRRRSEHRSPPRLPRHRLPPPRGDRRRSQRRSHKRRARLNTRTRCHTRDHTLRSCRPSFQCRRNRPAYRNRLRWDRKLLRRCTRKAGPDPLVGSVRLGGKRCRHTRSDRPRSRRRLLFRTQRAKRSHRALRRRHRGPVPCSRCRSCRNDSGRRGRPSHSRRPRLGSASNNSRCRTSNSRCRRRLSKRARRRRSWRTPDRRRRTARRCRTAALRRQRYPPSPCLPTRLPSPRSCSPRCLRPRGLPRPPLRLRVLPWCLPYLPCLPSLPCQPYSCRLDLPSRPC
jgi:hypothetical protein